MLTVLSDLLRFMHLYRKYWLAPILVVLLALGLLMIAAQSTAIGPFIYAIF